MKDKHKEQTWGADDLMGGLWATPADGSWLLLRVRGLESSASAFGQHQVFWVGESDMCAAGSVEGVWGEQTKIMFNLNWFRLLFPPPKIQTSRVFFLLSTLNSHQVATFPVPPLSSCFQNTFPPDFQFLALHSPLNSSQQCLCSYSIISISLAKANKGPKLPSLMVNLPP